MLSLQKQRQSEEQASSGLSSVLQTIQEQIVEIKNKIEAQT